MHCMNVDLLFFSTYIYTKNNLLKFRIELHLEHMKLNHLEIAGDVQRGTEKDSLQHV